MTRFTCVSSSGEAGGGGGGGQWRIGCSLGCLCWKDSSNEEGSVRRRSKGMCCLQKSTGESYREERGRCCSSCGKWSKGKCGLRCLHCFHCQRSSEEEEESRKRGKCPCPFCRKSKEESALVEKQRCWKSCFCRNKSSSEEETARRRGKCGMGCFFCCNKSPKTEEPSRKREKCGMCFLCCEKSPKEEEPSRKRGKCETGCFRCTKSSSEESARKRNRWSTCCFCCNKSSTKGEETRGGEEKAKGCFHCDYFSSCCKSSKEEESRRRGEKATCCCYRKRTTGSGSSPRRGCAKNFGCNSCCSKPACKKKIRCSRTLCWKRKENKQPNHLASLVESISFKSDSGGRQRSAVEEILRIGNGNIAARVFTYRQLTAATQNFNPECLLGTGGFGKVYKGQLEDTKEIVAVKQLDRQGYQGNREFLIEVLMLSLLDHENLVNLLGYCAAGNERILVYEFMALGSLQDHLHDLSPNRKPLDWITRMKIAAGAARGLEYLHDRANPPVIYRDLKASNILLDKDFTPKLSDFGLAKLGPVGEQKHVSTRVRGTYGYCAPEYVRTGKLTKMSDVYSFGVLLLEIITGRKPMDKTRPPSEQVLLEWATPLVQDKKKFVELADPLLEGKFPVKALYQALAIASVCLQENSSTRPVVMDIVIALEFLAAQNSCNQEEPEASTAQNSLP